MSQLTMVIAITGLDRASKSTLTSAFNTTSKGTFTVGGIGGSASRSITANLAEVVELGKRLGTVSLDYVATGGPGISAAGDSLKTADPENIKGLLDGLAAAANGFTQANSAPEKMLLIPLTIFGIPATPVDYAKLQQLAKLKQHAADVEAQIKVLEDYKTQNSDFFGKYYVDSLTKLQGLDAEIITYINSCASGGSCKDSAIDPDIAFLEDAFTDAKPELSCTYSAGLARYSSNGKKTTVSLLQNATVNLTGKIRFSDQIDIAGVKVYRLNLDTGKIDDRTSAALNGIQLSEPDATQARKAFASIDYQSFDSITKTANTVPIAQVTEQLLTARRQLTGSTYMLEFPTRLWLPKLVVAVGIPDAGKCPASQRSQ